LTSDSKPKKIHLKGVLNFVLSIILAVVLLYVAFHDVNFGEILDIVSHASVFWIVVLSITFLLSHFVRAIRWKIILNSVKKNTSMKNLFGSLMVGYAVNCVIPRLGEITRAVLIGRWEGLSRSSMLGAVIVERVIDIIFLGLSVLISVYIWQEDLYSSFPWLKSTLYLSMIGILLFVLFIYLTIRFKEHFYGIIIRLIGKVSKKAAGKAAYIFEMLTQGFSSLQGTKNYLFTFGLSVVIMLLYALCSYFGFYTLFMENIRPVNFAMAWVLMSISGIGVVIPTPGATGSYHALAKSALMLFGFGEVISLSYAFLTHIISYVLFIIIGFLSFIILNKRHESLIKVVETGIDEL
jgi:glycosyltransferase 2 family protein